jgi:hypothetical protein
LLYVRICQNISRSNKKISEEKRNQLLTDLCGKAQVFSERSVDRLFLEDFEGIAA